MRRMLALAATAGLLTGACGAETNMSPDLSLDAAQRRVIDTVDSTAQAAAQGLEVFPYPERRRTDPCLDPELASSGLVSSSYGVIIELPDDAAGDAVAERTRELWEGEDRGRVDPENLGSEQPTIYLYVDGFTFELLVNKGMGRAFLIGGTPCVQPAEGASASSA